MNLLEEFGMKASLTVAGDAAAALSAAAKLSGGRMRHLRACETFIKQMVKRRLCSLCKIGTKENVGDLLTKHVSRQVLDVLVTRTGWRAPTPHEKQCVPACKHEHQDLRSR